MDIKGFIADQMGMFSPYDVPNGLFAILVAACVGAAFTWFGARSKGMVREMAVWAGLAAFATVMVKGSVPLSIALVALVLLVRADHVPTDRSERLLRTAVVLIGGACGSGAALIAVVLAVPIALFMRWAVPMDPR